MFRLRLVGCALLAVGFLVPASTASAYYSAGSVTTFGYSGTATVQPYTSTFTSSPGTTTPTSPSPITPPTSPPPTTTGGQTSSGGSPLSASSFTSQGSTTYFGGSGASSGGSPVITWNVGGGQSPATPPVVGPTTNPTGTPPANQANLVAQFLSLVNAARAQNGAQPLTENPVLDKLAQAKAQDLATYNYFNHYSPRLGWPVDQETAAGFRAYSMGAENLAETASVQVAFSMLMASPLHRQNILDTAFTQTGIAIVPVQNGVLVDQFFTGPSY